MESELTHEQFHQRLSELTAPLQAISLSVYDFSGKPFCGEFTNESFELTKNSHFRHIKGIVIKGKYEQNENNKTEVTLAYEPPRKGRKLLYALLIILFVVINIVNFLYIGELHFFEVLRVFFWMISTFYLVVGIGKLSRFIVFQRFKQEFEIDIKPTDLYGYGGE